MSTYVVEVLGGASELHINMETLRDNGVLGEKLSVIP